MRIRLLLQTLLSFMQSRQAQECMHEKKKKKKKLNAIKYHVKFKWNRISKSKDQFSWNETVTQALITNYTLIKIVLWFDQMP